MNAIHSLSQGSAPNPASLPTDKTQTVSRPIFRDLLTGFKNSRVLRTAIFTTAIVLSALFLASNPLGWAGAIAISGIAIATLLLAKTLASSKDRQKIAFEFGVFKRMVTQNKYDEIQLPNKKEGQGRIFLSALPNRLANWEEIVKKEQIEHIFSFNEPWERAPLGLLIPFRDADWNAIGVAVHNHDLEDHTSFTAERWFSIANEILTVLDSGKNVDVHCKAGQGRSAIAVATTSILQTVRDAKEQGIELNKQHVLDAVTQAIQEGRPSSTIGNKREILEAFYDYTIQNIASPRLESKPSREASQPHLLTEVSREAPLPPRPAEMPFFGLGKLALSSERNANRSIDLSKLLYFASWFELAQSLIGALSPNQTLYISMQNDNNPIKGDYIIAIMHLTHLVTHSEAKIDILRNDRNQLISMVIQKIEKYTPQSEIRSQIKSLEEFYDWLLREKIEKSPIA